VNDCCLTPNEQIFSYIIIMARTSYIWWDDDVGFVLDQHTSLDLIVLFHWYNSPWVDMSLHSDTLS